MSTYIAWDGKEYPLPIPKGWYLGTDDRWWPEGHGPGPSATSPSPEEFGASSGLPSAAPPSDRTVYSAPLPGPGTRPDSPPDGAASADDGGVGG